MSEYERDPGTTADEPNPEEGKEPMPQMPAEAPTELPDDYVRPDPDEERNPAS